MKAVKTDKETEGAPKWADGCEDCEFGVVSEKPGNNKLALYQRHRAGWRSGNTIFCHCRAGRAQAHYAQVDLKERSKKVWVLT